MNILKKATALVICLSIIMTMTCNVSAYSIVKPVDLENGEQVSSFFDSLMEYIEKNYKLGITREELMQSAISEMLKENPELYTDMVSGAVKVLDENSHFYKPEEFEAVNEDVSGIYAGIGMYVHQNGTEVMLGEAIKGAPAENSGLRVGDIVVAVNGTDVRGHAIDKVTSLIKGPTGTDVSITVLRNGREYTYTLKRAVVKINPVEFEIIDDTDIGYIKLSSFNANTNDAIDEAMKYFGENKVSKIILDLRNNLGGYLDAAVHLASYFIPDGKLVVTQEYVNEKDNINHYADKTDYKFKTVVLINEYSASASEVVSSAVRDYKTGILVGRTSYGKGTIQAPFLLRCLNYLWLTIGKYYTPEHKEIHKVGIEPDYYIANSTKKFDMNNVPKYEITRVLKKGDVGEDVLAVEKRLVELGYLLSADDEYDENTVSAVKSFQSSIELFSYGKADITTQIKINDVLSEMDVVDDRQYDKALEIAKNLK